MTKKFDKKLIKNIIPLLSVAIIILLWYLLSLEVGKEIIIPAPSSVATSLAQLFGDKMFYKAVGNTLLRTIQSYALALGIALVLAILSALNTVVEKILSPVVIITRTMPTMSIILLALIWLSSGNAPVFVAYLVIFPLLYTGSLDSIKRVDNNLINMAKIYKVGKVNIVTKLYIRETLPSMFSLVRSTLSFTLKLIIAGEVLAHTSSSMGLFMQRSSAYLDTATLIAWTAIAIFLGYLLELIVRLIQALVIRWDK